MGGGIAGHELAAAVSEAGGLGTIGLLPPPQLRRELDRARALTAKPVAVNVIQALSRPAHWEVARDADLVVTFWGPPRRRTARTWLHQCGSVEEARAAHAAGADGVIAQGVEAGGHVRGETPALELLERTRAALPDGFPVLVAGGIADASDVAQALDAGAAAAVLGTRYLLTEESGAHPDYKQRVREGSGTLLTQLFGAGWPGAHRVLANQATDRWLGDDPVGPGWLRALHRATAPLLARAPDAVTAGAAALQRPGSPLLSPQPPVAGGPPGLVEAGPLYAGETVSRLTDLRGAGELTRELAG
jgi:nitronate monooxygenase